MATTRRQFLRNTACGTLSAFAMAEGLEKLFLTSALAQSNGSNDYKALVCIFLFGGNDSNNIVIPYDDYDGDGVDGYGPVRGGSVQLAIQKANLLQITPPSDPGGKTYGLHPALGTLAGQPNDGLYGLWNAGKAAISVNTGTMINPLANKDQLRAGTFRPYQLFSHSDQQADFMSSVATGPSATGWGGRVADRIRGSQTFPVVTSIAGLQVFTQGFRTQPLVANSYPTPINQLLQIARDFAPDNPLDQLVALDLGSGYQMVKSSAQVPDELLRIRGEIQGAGNPENPDWRMSCSPDGFACFPNTGLGNQLLQVAKLIKTSLEVLQGDVRRQIFFVSLGGFDTHNNEGRETGTQATLWTQVSQAMGALYQATVELGVADRVTQFTMSDFSRTFKPANPGAGVGTDHAWGGHHFVVGDSVMGGDFYGMYPDVHLGAGGDYDLGSGSRGRWIPTQSVDQYAYTLANWFGVQPDDVAYVFPNQYLNLYNPLNLGFMAGGAGAKGNARVSASLSNTSSRR